ncbi:MAG: TetR/AcrR family transcriptional regulator [Eubacterium sp.]
MNATKNNDENQKEKILSTTKTLFYEKGYRGTTIAMIAEASGVSVGLVNYYYKKEELLGQIFHDFILYIRRFLNEKLGSLIENQFQMHLLFNRIFFIKIFESPAIESLYSYMREKDLYLDITHNYIRNSMTSIILEFDLDIDKELFRQLTVAEYGARKSLYQDRALKDIPRNSIAFIDFQSTITVRLAGVSPSIIEKNIKRTNTLMRYIDINCVNFLDDFNADQ